MTTKTSPGMKMLPKKTKHAIKIQHVLSLFPDDKSFEICESICKRRKNT